MFRRRSLAPSLAVAAVAGLVALTAFAVWAMKADADGCSANGVTLPVAASPEIAPALADVAQRWATTKPEINGKCVRVDVRAVPSADMASSLAVRVGGRVDIAAQPVPTPSDRDIPAVWVPDSIAWVNRVLTADRAAFVDDSPSIALSPVVIAIPESVVRQLLGPAAGPASPAVLTALVDKLQARQLKLAFVEPRRDTAGLAGAMLLRDQVVTGEDKLPALVMIYRGIGRLPDQAALKEAYAGGLQMSTMSEQALLAYNVVSPQAPLAAVPLPAGGPALDYPYATLAGKPREVEQAAARFRVALENAAYADSFARKGFRAPGGLAAQGFPTGHGITADPIAGNPVSDFAAVQRAIGLWSAAVEPSRTLALLDVTSSMDELVAPDTSKLALLRTAATGGLQLFSNESSLGLWAYADGHREIAPMGTLTPTHRDVLNSAISGVRVDPTDQCALYESLLAAYEKVKSEYQPGVTNRIVVFVDGRNTKAGMSLELLQRELEKQADPNRPIVVTLIGVGPGVDKKELDALAQATGGKEAFQVVNPTDIGLIFLKALLA